MYRAQTALEIAGLALAEIGEPPIGAFNENSARAREVVRWYGSKRDEILRGHEWGFAGAWIVPAKNPLPAIGRLKHRFPLPEDCLKVRQVLPHVAAPANCYGGVVITDPAIIAILEGWQGVPLATQEWDIEAASVAGEAPVASTVMVTNMAQPLVNYTRRIDAIRLWDPQAVTAFVKELASAIAPKLAKDITAGEKKHAESADYIEQATRTDSREESPRHVRRETSWVRSRYIGRGYFDRNDYP